MKTQLPFNHTDQISEILRKVTYVEYYEINKNTFYNESVMRKLIE